VPGAKLTVKVRTVEVEKRLEQMSAPEQSGEGPFLSTSTNHWCGAPSPLLSLRVILSPWVTVMVGLGLLVVPFHAEMKPVSVIVLFTPAALGMSVMLVDASSAAPSKRAVNRVMEYPRSIMQKFRSG